MGIQNAGGSLAYSAGSVLYSLLLSIYGWSIGYYLWTPLLVLVTFYSYRYISHIKHGETKRNIDSILKIVNRQFA